MLRKLLLFALVILVLPVSAQTPEEVFRPRYGDGVAVIRRPSTGTITIDSFYLFPVMTTDNRYVFAASDTQTELLRWDISQLSTEQIEPMPVSVDLSAFIQSDHIGYTQVAQLDNTLIVQVDTTLLQLNIETFEILQQVNVAGLLDIEFPHVFNFGGLYVDGPYVAAIYDFGAQAVVVWDTDSGEMHVFSGNIAHVSRLNNHWVITQWGDDAFFVDICDQVLENCERFEGNAGLVQDDVVAIGGLWNRELDTTYYRISDTIDPIHSPFPGLRKTALPLSASPDGNYVLVRRQASEDDRGGVPFMYAVWDINRQVETLTLAVGSFGPDTPLWFGEHFLARNYDLYSADSQTVQDRFDWSAVPIRAGSNMQDYLMDDYHIAGLKQVSNDGTRLLNVTGGAALVLPIETQRVDDLLKVGQAILTLENDDVQHVALAADGMFLVSASPDRLSRWDVATGEQVEIAVEGASENSALSIVGEEVHLLTDDEWLVLSLDDLDIIETTHLEASGTEQPILQRRSGERIVMSNDVVGFVSDEEILVRDGDSVIRQDIGGLNVDLHAREDGWLVYQFDSRSEQHILTTCSLLLTDCQTYPIEQPLFAFDGSNLVVTGEYRQLWADDFGYWMLGNSLEPAPKMIEDAGHTPVDFYEDYMVVVTPESTLNDHAFELWSAVDNHMLIREALNEPFGENDLWEWSGDYFIQSTARHINLVNLSNGRFTRWTPGEKIIAFDVSANGSRLVVITESTVSVHPLVR